MRKGRAIVAGVAGAVAWLVGLALVFGPAQAILADPALQSAKFLAAFTEDPLPRAGDGPWVVPAGVLLVSMVHAFVFAWLAPGLPGRGWRKGFAFGLCAWLLMTPWFEFYLPWNVMREPLPLVLLEVVLWGIVMQMVGLAIAIVYRPRPPEAPARDR